MIHYQEEQLLDKPHIPPLEYLVFLHLTLVPPEIASSTHDIMVHGLEALRTT